MSTNSKADYDRIREQHANKKALPLVTLAEARANKTKVDWANYPPVKPKFIGRRVFKNFDLSELANYIDWGPFFQTWDLAGPYPAILNDEIVGESARRVFSRRQVDARASDRGPLAAGQRRDRAAAGQHRERRRHRDLHGRIAHAKSRSPGATCASKACGRWWTA